jgi:hypothetical protein
MKAVLSFLLGLLVNEGVDCGPWFAKRLVMWSSRRLPDAESRQRYEEEYLATIDAVPGRLSPLFVALGIVANVPRMRRRVRADRPPPGEQDSGTFFAIYTL